MKTRTVIVDIYDIEWDKGELEDYEWYCDNCNERLDYQDGFDCRCGEWKCSECGHLNAISLENIRNNKPTSESSVYIYGVTSIHDLRDKIEDYLLSVYRCAVINYEYRYFCEDDLPEEDYYEQDDDYDLADFCRGGDLSEN